MLLSHKKNSHAQNFDFSRKKDEYCRTAPAYRIVYFLHRPR